MKSSSSAPNAKACVGKHEEETAANDSDHQGECLHDFIHLLLVIWKEAIGDSVIGESNRRKDHH
jgi:hypothetical protein